MPMIRHLLRCLALFFVLVTSVAGAQTTRVENTATLSFAGEAGVRQVRSNTVSLDTTRTRRPTSLSFRLPPPGYSLAGMSCQALPTSAFTPAPIDAATLATAPRLAKLDVTTPYIIVLENQAGNYDPAVRETMTIKIMAANRASELPLLETAPDSGVFAGGVPATGTHPELSACDLKILAGEKLALSFEGEEDADPCSTEMLIDPAGFVFDSADGKLVDGAVISLVDANGAPAQVFGDDGVSRYPSTMVSGSSVTDESGRVYPAIPGRYRFPLTFPGRYFLKVTPPGDYTAPSTVDLATLEALRDPAGRPFTLNDASFGRALVLDSPEPFFADIPIDRPRTAALLLGKTASVREAAPGDVVQYRLQLTNRGETLARDVRITDTLPAGLRYRRGSTRGAAEPDVSADGRQLVFAVPPLDGGATATLTYIVSIAPGAPVGEATNRARANGTGIASNEAAAAVRLRPALFSDAITLIGRVTEGNCHDPVNRRRGVPGIRILLEDGTFTVTDRDGLYHVEGVPAGRHVVQLETASLPATYAPVACDNDTRQAGSATSRFMEGVGGVLKRVDFQLKPTGKVGTASDALPIQVVEDAVAAGNRDWLTGQTPGTAWLFPAAGHNPRAPAQRVVVKHGPGERVALTINGVRVDPITFDGTDTAGAVAVSRWVGIPLARGDNRLVATVLAKDGTVATVLERAVHFSGPGVRATLDPKLSRLVADGLSRPLIAVRVMDAGGRPVRAGTTVAFRVDQPYRAAAARDREQRQAMAGRTQADATAIIMGDEGVAFLPLEPTTQAGAVRAVVKLADEQTTRDSEIRTWLAAAARDWTVVGFGAGSLGYDTLKTHARGLPAGRRGRTITDGQLALYAKGRIKGSWLLTLAYDSDRRYDRDRGLLGTIDPNRYYTVYGDGTLQGYDAPTRRRLYLRLERREAYALFGDFETGFTDTQLTRYSRTLNGVKAAYEGRRLRAAGFAARIDTRYARDEIQGNGLSGPYRLTQRGIVPNSDKLRIETRDRFRSERILASRTLARHIDYDIDARAGTVRFREPVLSRDAGLNPVFIVADYEVESGRTSKLAAAARVEGRLADGRVAVGASAIRDETIGTATVLGADIRAKLGAGTEVRGEFAGGGRGGIGDGLAYLAEAEHHGAGVDLLLYARQQDVRFGVGQQNLVEAGTRKLGFDTRVQLAERFTLTGTGWHQTQLVGPGTRTAGEAKLEYARTNGTLFAGAQVADDRGLDGRDRNSLLLTLGGSRIIGDRLTLAAQTQLAPGGDKASVDFPARHQVTASWQATPGVRLIAGYEIAEGADFAARTAQIGFDVAPWAGAKLTGALNNQLAGENPARAFAQYGLSQALPIGQHWTVDLSLDASSTVRGRIPAGGAISAFQPAASGGFLGAGLLGGDYTAVTLGAGYRAGRWNWNGRVERRTSDMESRWGLTSNLLRSLGEGRTLASGVRAFRSTDRAGATAAIATADVALALRPLDSPWSLLERIEVLRERAGAGFLDTNVLGVSTFGLSGQATTRAVNNLAVNYRTGPEGAGHAAEATIYYGLKWVRGRLGDEPYDGVIDVTGFDLRRDVGRSFDIGVQGSVQHAWTGADAWAWSAGPSVGMSPGGGIWVSAGYNLSGYRDRDFEADRYTRKGPYFTMRVKFDQRSLTAAASRMWRAGR